jgi:DNA modification methylase
MTRAHSSGPRPSATIAPERRESLLRAAPSELTVQHRPIESLAPYGKNPRSHSEAQVDQIAASIREYGWTNPVLVDGEHGVIAGHGRLLAAKKLGLAEVPVIELAHLTRAQRRALVLADNKIAENAGWDFALLRDELLALDHMNFDLGLIGFAPGEIEQIMNWAPPNGGLTEPDEAPAAPVDPVTRLGDTWICGRHRVRCGDATRSADVRALLGAVEPMLMVTDPPYGVEYDPDWRNRVDRANGKSYGARAVGVVTNDDRADWREAWALFRGDVAYVWHAGTKANIVAETLDASGFEIRSQVIWAKSRFAISRGHYHVQHEPCWYAVRKGGTGHWRGDRSQTTLWEIEHLKSETGHSTQKPVECMRRPIVNNSAPGQPVYDPFLGSGTTMIAAEMEGRTCLGLEIAPQYVDVIVQRWQNFTGTQAILGADGRTFEETRGVRRDSESKREDGEGGWFDATAALREGKEARNAGES